MPTCNPIRIVADEPPNWKQGRSWTEAADAASTQALRRRSPAHPAIASPIRTCPLSGPLTSMAQSVASAHTPVGRHMDFPTTNLVQRHTTVPQRRHDRKSWKGRPRCGHPSSANGTARDHLTAWWYCTTPLQSAAPAPPWAIALAMPVPFPSQRHHTRTPVYLMRARPT